MSTKHGIVKGAPGTWYAGESVKVEADDLIEAAVRVAVAIVSEWREDGADPESRPADAIALVEWSVRWGFIEESEVEHLPLRW